MGDSQYSTGRLQYIENSHQFAEAADAVWDAACQLALLQTQVPVKEAIHNSSHIAVIREKHTHAVRVHKVPPTSSE